MLTDVKELAVWWLSQADSQAIAVSERAPGNLGWPEYLVSEFNSRYGRAGRGRLWVPPGITIRDIHWPDPETPIATICSNCGGIVFWRKDIEAIKQLPGLITDMELNRFFEADHA